MSKKTELFEKKLRTAPTSSASTFILPWDMALKKFRLDLQDNIYRDDETLTILEVLNILKKIEKAQYFKKIENEKESLPLYIGISFFSLLFLNSMGIIFIQEFRDVGLFIMLFGVCCLFIGIGPMLQGFRENNEKNYQVMLENREREFGMMLNKINIVELESKPFKFSSGPYGAWIEIKVEIKEKVKDEEKKEEEKKEEKKESGIDPTVQNSNFNYPAPPQIESKEKGKPQYEAYGGSIGNTGSLPPLPQSNSYQNLPYRPPIIEQPEAEDERDKDKLPPILDVEVKIHD